jgi:two-component system OmpR family sensor kinase
MFSTRDAPRPVSPGSVRWTLLLGYGLLLLSVVASFGTALYLQAKSSAERSLDAALTGRAQAIAAALEHESVDGWELDLSSEYLRGLAADTRYTVLDPEGKVVFGDGPAALTDASQEVDTVAWREVWVAGPAGTRVIVGRSTDIERKALASLLLTILGTGLGILVLGLGAVWWLASRVLAPVDALAEAVAAVHPSDLSARLDESRAPDELAGLARAFNASLGRIEEAFARQVRFTADASHELRTPLAVIRTQVELAMRAPRTAIEYRETLEACLRAVERMGGLVEGLLTLARSDASDAAAPRPQVALDELVEDQAEFLRPLAEAADVELDFTLEPAQVRGDPRLLGDAVRNLIDNGVRYNHRGGRVDVALASEGLSAVLRVRDTGQGIPPESREQVFERFHRLDDARSRDHGGAGLGLAIVRSIVEAHGGSVSVESSAGQGSTFTVRLPVANGVGGE